MKEKLSFKFIISTALTLVLILGIVTIITVKIFIGEYKNLVREKSEVLAKPLIESINKQLELTDGDLQGIIAFNLDMKKIIDNNKEVVNAEIVNIQGKVLAAPSEKNKDYVSNKKLLEKVRSSRKYFIENNGFNHLFYPVNFKNKGTVAYLHLIFDTEFMNNTIKKIIIELSFITVVALFLVYILLNYLIRKNIIIHINELGNFANSVAAGDLSQSISINTGDEMEELGRATQSMVEGLRGIVEKILYISSDIHNIVHKVDGDFKNVQTGSNKQTNSLQEADKQLGHMKSNLSEIIDKIENLYTSIDGETSDKIKELSASSDEVGDNMEKLTISIKEISVGIDEIANSINQVNQNVQKLANDSDEMATSAAEINASIEAVEKNTRQNTELSKAVTKNAEAGMSAVEKTYDGVVKIRKTVEDIYDNIVTLQERTKEIGNITLVINHVAERTNLLSLNASIIAAQAGEHGRSFAVVADQIRNLAQKVTNSTKEIDSLIKGVQDESDNAVIRAKEGINDVINGQKLTEVAKSKLNEILESSKESLELSETIFNATKEQSKGTGFISDTSERITNVAHEFAKAMEIQASSSAEIVKATEAVNELSETIRSSLVSQKSHNDRLTDNIERNKEFAMIISKSSSEYRKEANLVFNIVHENISLIETNNNNLHNIYINIEDLISRINELSEDVKKFKV